jgi:hypothetical protein
MLLNYCVHVTGVSETRFVLNVKKKIAFLESAQSNPGKGNGSLLGKSLVRPCTTAGRVGTAMRHRVYEEGAQSPTRRPTGLEREHRWTEGGVGDQRGGGLLSRARKPSWIVAD